CRSQSLSKSFTTSTRTTSRPTNRGRTRGASSGLPTNRPRRPGPRAASRDASISYPNLPPARAVCRTMNNPDMAATLGITEAEWLACGNPVRLVKRFRDRGSGRRYVLLACAYALDVPQVGLRGPGREVVEAVRRLAVSAPSAGWSGSEMHVR